MEPSENQATIMFKIFKNIHKKLQYFRRVEFYKHAINKFKREIIQKNMVSTEFSPEYGFHQILSHEYLLVLYPDKYPHSKIW